jgi:hypothetical protein
MSSFDHVAINNCHSQITLEPATGFGGRSSRGALSQWCHQSATISRTCSTFGPLFGTK